MRVACVRRICLCRFSQAEEGEQCSITEPKQLDLVAEMLQLSPTELRGKLTMRTMVTGAHSSSLTRQV